MAKQLKKYFTTIDQIAQGKVINSWHVSQSIDAFTGADYYDIKISGSLEVIGDVFFNLKDQEGSTANFKYLGVDVNTKKVGYYSFSSQIAPLEINSFTKTAWNNGPGNYDSNTSFGYYSFVSNTTGVGNTIIGSSNALSSQTGYNNTVLGFSNLSNGVNPYYNVAIGVQTLYNNNSDNNIAIGVQTLYSSTIGSSNVALGNKALYFNISGNNNVALGSHSLYNNKGSNNIALGYEASKNDSNGSNRISLGTYSGKVTGSNYLEIHSYFSPTSNESPLILGRFDERWLQINGNLRVDLSLNPSTSLNSTPYQLLFDSTGRAYTSERGLTITELADQYQSKGDYVISGSVYTKLETDNKFVSGGIESLTSIQKPVLTGNVLTLKYTGEDGTLQQQTVDLSSLSTRDIHITGASYDAATNKISLVDNDNNTFEIDLSEFQLLVNIDTNGVATLTQEGVTKITLSKVARTGLFADILSKPTTLGGYGIIDAINISPTAQTKPGNLTVDKIITSGGTASQFVKGDGSLDNSVYLTSAGLANYVTLNTIQTITGEKTFAKLNTTDWLSPRYIALNDSVGTVVNKIGLLQDNNDFKINWLNSTNGYIYELLRISGVTGVATFNGNVTASKLITSGGTLSQFVKGDGSLDPTNYIPTTHPVFGISAEDILGWSGGEGSQVNGVTVTPTTITILQATGAVSGSIPQFNQDTTGNAATSTQLQTPRLINGTSFDGTSDITTTKWGIARSITIGDATKQYDGSGNLVFTAAEIGADPGSHNHDDRYYTETEINEFFGGLTSISGYNKSQWDTAYSWGTHVGKYTPLTRTLTINGVTKDLTQNQSWDFRYYAGTGLTLTGDTFSVNYGTTSGTAASGNDARFHNKFSLGTANGLSLGTGVDDQKLSLAIATGTTSGAMSAADKTKLDTLISDRNGTVTSIGLSMPPAFNVGGSPISVSGSLEVTMNSSYSIPTKTSQSKWDTTADYGDHREAGYITSEVLTTLDQPTISGSTLTLKYTGENGVQQVKSINLSSTGDRNIVIEKNIPSNEWVLDHGLNKFPSITIVDSSGNEVEGAITHVNELQAIARFNFPFGGKAYCN